MPAKLQGGWDAASSDQDAVSVAARFSRDLSMGSSGEQACHVALMSTSNVRVAGHVQDLHNLSAVSFLSIFFTQSQSKYMHGKTVG